VSDRLLIGFTLTTAITSAFKLWMLRKERRPSVEKAFQAGMLFVAAPVTLLLLAESVL